MDSGLFSVDELTLEIQAGFIDVIVVDSRVSYVTSELVEGLASLQHPYGPFPSACSPGVSQGE